MAYTAIAGLVGQNLVARLKEKGYTNLVVLDKHRANIEILRRMHPDIVIEYAELAEAGDWQRHFSSARAVVMLQAQIGGIWQHLSTENFRAQSDYDGYQADFHRLFGFDVPGVDYTAPTEVTRPLA